ncbi:hypothetical protein [Hominisplanchenecus murintestinalis]|uniref:hypothetical protein n=1 Tax=Hominisplanchenecus murintestinalis TaxID=2941517 RepID=UPI00203FB525|nr:hypothetical protein [Hominisplanchenecus murintestinalis]
MFLPVFVCKMGSYFFKLVGKAQGTGNPVGLLQCRRDRRFMFRLVLPELEAAGVFTSAGIGNIKYITQPWPVPAVINKGDPLGAAPHIPPHGLVPEVIIGTGCGIGPLGKDHELLREGIFIQAGGGSEKRCPLLKAAGQSGRLILGHRRIVL